MEFGEWMRIRNGLKKAEDEAKRREQKILEQQALHEMSKSLVKNWENTIEVSLKFVAQFASGICIMVIGSKIKKIRSQKDPRGKRRSNMHSVIATLVNLTS